MTNQENDRKRAISFAQIVLVRVQEAVGEDVYFEPKDCRIQKMISKYSSTDSSQILGYVTRYFKDNDVRAALGVNADNEQRVYTRLHCMMKAIGQNNPRRRKPFFFTKII